MLFKGEVSMITSDEIKKRLWDGANNLRGSMDASRYKDYMLGIMFYKFFSEQTLKSFKTTSGLTETDGKRVVELCFKGFEQYGDHLSNMIQGFLGYYVLPEYLYQTWLSDINNGEFEVQHVIDSLNN